MQSINKVLINISIKLTHYKVILHILVKNFADGIATATRILFMQSEKKNVFVIVNTMQ